MTKSSEIILKNSGVKPDTIVRLFKNNDVKLALLFGSTVEVRHPRDVDVAVLFKDYNFDTYTKTYEGLRQLIKGNNVDLVVLNRSNAALKLEALLKGDLLFVADKESLTDFGVQTLSEYEDYRYFKKEYTANFKERSLSGLSMFERKINKERVETYLSILDEAVGELTKLKKGFASFDDFKGNIESRELCVHYLRIALESVLNVCRHFLAVKGVSLTEIDTTNIIELAGEKGLIPYGFAKKIRGMAGMRNAIVHAYWRLDYEAIYRSVTEELADFDEFARQVELFLKREET